MVENATYGSVQITGYSILRSLSLLMIFELSPYDRPFVHHPLGEKLYMHSRYFRELDLKWALIVCN